MPGEAFGVDQRAGAFHAVEDVAHRDFDFAIDAAETFVGGDLWVHALMQTQAEVGVFRAVFGGERNIDLVEADLVYALAAQILVGDRLKTEVAPRELAEIMAAHAGLSGFEHIGLQQGVVSDAGERDAVVGQNVLVVFEVLSDLGARGRFEPGF